MMKEAALVKGGLIIDSVTHTLFGLSLYGAVNKEKLPKELKKPLFVTAVGGSLIPDIDVISQLWDHEGLYQMWHRGITHSVFFVPIWALFFFLLCYLIWGTKDRRILYMGMLAVFIHNTSDLFNTWGTGYLEPFSAIRISFGTIPIIDFVVWGIMLLGFLLVRYKRWIAHNVYKGVWLAIVAHFILQSTQGYVIYHSVADQYEQHVVSASFIPGHFQIIGKNGERFEIVEKTVWSKPQLQYQLISAKHADLEDLFTQNPKAKTLVEWSPFVVVVDDEEYLGVYDPRFYRNGESFLYEYILK